MCTPAVVPLLLRVCVRAVCVCVCVFVCVCAARPTAHTETDEPPARAAQLEYEVVDPALLHFERVDFLDDASSGGPLSTHEPSQAPPPPSGQSAGVEGGGGDGQRRKDLSSSSLFAGVEDDAGDDWLRLAKRP